MSACGSGVLLQNVFEARAGQGLSARVDKDFWNRRSATNGQPCAKRRGGLLPKWQAALPATFASYHNGCMRMQGQVFKAEAYEL